MVPILFVKYTRQYIVDDTEKGKLKKLHTQYANWFSPLEVVAMNLFSVLFIAIEMFIIVNASWIAELLKIYGYSLINNNKILKFINSIDPSDIQTSAILALLFYVASYFIYYVYVYKIWTPKWEKKRKENELAYRRNNQLVADNLREAMRTESEI
jgi:hypothetical protein